MALPKLPGQVGYEVYRRSSLDKRAIGKLTASNHLKSLQHEEPEMYDKAIIQIYTQTGMKANDFTQMLDKATPYTPDGDTWQWKTSVPYKLPRITHIPTTTINKVNAGTCGQDDDIFEIVTDKPFYLNTLITPSRYNYPAQWMVIQDPEPAGIHNGYLLRLKLVSTSPLDSVPAKYMKVGMELLGGVDNLIGEFNQELSGFNVEGEEMTLMESMSGGFGFEHTITSWADAKTLRDPKTGQPLDINIYAKLEMNETGTIQVKDTRWEPFVERQMRQKMMEASAHRRIWGKPGWVKHYGTGELVKAHEGVYWKIKNNGNYAPYNRGQFSIAFLRGIFGDLFYRRVDVAERRVKMYTNEAGFDVFEKANWDDLQRMGFTLDAGSSDRFIQGQGRNMVVNYAISSVVTRETGKIELVHLKELDLPQTQLEFGQNKKSTPKFIVFDVSATSDGTPASNIREVRMKGQPSMTWGYVNGRRHHLGFANSQGMDSANMFPGYKIWMEDRADIFIEDLSRMVLIEERPEE